MGQQKKQTDKLKFIHITDTHILDNAFETFHGINTKKSLESVLLDGLNRYSDIDFLLVTGDISQTSNKESYAIFKSVIETSSVPVYCVPGNHDSPHHLQNIIPSSPTNSINVINLEKFSLVLLSSWVNNQHHGAISKDNLQHLRKLLSNDDQQIFIIAIHHSPVSVNSKWLDELGLYNQDEFLEILKSHPKYKLVLFGHVHQKIDQQISDIHLISTPSTCHQFKVNSEEMDCVLFPPPAYRYIELNHARLIETKIHYIK